MKAAKIQIESFSAALDLYYLDNGVYPAGNEGLTALVERPSSALRVERALPQDWLGARGSLGSSLCL